RMKFSAYVAFVLLWSTLVYDPVAHWIWAEKGWLAQRGALDFAGGTVVHLAAGISALVCALVLGKRTGYPHERHQPHNLTMTLTGAGILWFGWFGFNAGSAPGANGLAALGVASGLVAGLVGITPAAGFVAPWASIVIGAAAGLVCYAAVVTKERLG